MSNSELAAVAPTKGALSKPAPREAVTWNDIGDGFEVLGKVGLALAIGMSAAGLFCRLAEQGEVKVPSLFGLMLHREQRQNRRQAPPKPRDA